VVFWNGQKHFDNFWVELRAGTAANFRVRVRHGKRIAIGPVAIHVQKLVLLRGDSPNDATDAARSEQAGQGPDK